MRFAIVAFVALGLAAPVLAEDDIPTPSQRAAVLRAISAGGCSDPAEIERDDGGYEVDSARCKDGIYDLKLSTDYKIISRDKEDG